MQTVQKYGLIIVKENKFLICKKKSTELFILPGGKPEGNETPRECIKREILEELGCKTDIESLKYLGDFSDIAANEKDLIVHIYLYSGKIIGEPKPSSEIEELRWFGKDDNPEILSPILMNKILREIVKKKII